MKSIVYEKVTLAEAKQVHDGKPRATWRDDWTSRRAAANDDEPLLAATREWLDRLPSALAPHELARRHVRIVNRLCALWNQPVRCSQYFADLLIVRRSSRQGFALAIAREIGNLAVHYENLHPPGPGWTVAR